LNVSVAIRPFVSNLKNCAKANPLLDFTARPKRALSRQGI
jgi:hypothetical protein